MSTSIINSSVFSSPSLLTDTLIKYSHSIWDRLRSHPKIALSSTVALAAGGALASHLWRQEKQTTHANHVPESDDKRSFTQGQNTTKECTVESALSSPSAPDQNEEIQRRQQMAKEWVRLAVGMDKEQRRTMSLPKTDQETKLQGQAQRDMSVFRYFMSGADPPAMTDVQCAAAQAFLWYFGNDPRVLALSAAVPPSSYGNYSGSSESSNAHENPAKAMSEMLAFAAEVRRFDPLIEASGKSQVAQMMRGLFELSDPPFMQSSACDLEEQGAMYDTLVSMSC